MAARTFTIDELVTRLEEMTDTQGDAHLSTAEKLRIVNSAIAETWDKIIDAGLGEKYVKNSNFSTVAGTLEYNLFTIATDFYRIHQLYVITGSGVSQQMRPLGAIAPAEVQMFRPPQSVITCRLYYIPYSPILTTGQTFDGINGWEEHTLVTAAMTVKAKKEDDLRFYRNRKLELEKRMKDMGQTDFSEPRRVVRKRKMMYDPFLIYNQDINSYLVRGDKVELMYNYGYVP